MYDNLKQTTILAYEHSLGNLGQLAALNTSARQLQTFPKLKHIPHQEVSGLDTIIDSGPLSPIKTAAAGLSDTRQCQP
jgi:hypothetical protein